MPFYSNHEANSRAHWAGAAANVDVHNELIQASVENGIRAGSLFATHNWSIQKSTENDTNTIGWRMIGGTSVGYRQVGETLEPKRVVNEKVIMKVDRAVYTQVQTDFMDDWTSPDFTAEYTAEMAEAHALEYDHLHMTQLIKAGAWKAPTSIESRYNPGVVRNMNGLGAANTDAAKAELILKYHAELVRDFVKRRTPLNNLITLLSPDMYYFLTQHPTRNNALFQPLGVTNDANRREVGLMNGVRTMEIPIFPTAAVANSKMGTSFNLSADEVKASIIVFDPTVTLITPTAKELHGFVTSLPHEQRTLITSIRMFNVGVKRGDRVGVLRTAQ